jgi:hypothetical protein
MLVICTMSFNGFDKSVNRMLPAAIFAFYT